MLVNIIQTPLPDKTVFDHRHQCHNCKKWGIYGSLTYLEKYEEARFVCNICQGYDFKQIPLPEKTTFRKKHECMVCKKLKKEGFLTYCPRCEESEFVCPFCHTGYHEYINPSRFNYDPLK